MPNYYLPPHIHFCTRGDASVFLDLRKDRYTLIDGTANEALRSICSGTCDVGIPAAAMSELLQHQLLTLEAVGSRAVLPTNIELAPDSLVDANAATSVHITISDVAKFLAACIRADLSLRTHSIEWIVRRVQKRKASHQSDKTLDTKEAIMPTAIFKSLRPYYPRDYLCLFDSLALVEFLSSHRIFPLWVFGVKLEPWAAHCWIQDSNYIFDGEIEDATSYTPIMAI